MGIPYLFTCRPVNLSTRVDMSRGKYRSAGHYGLFVLVHLSTCQPGLTGPEVNTGVQDLSIKDHRSITRQRPDD